MGNDKERVTIREQDKKSLDGIRNEMSEGETDKQKSLSDVAEDNFGGVYKHAGKPGLDIKEGKYRVSGIVTAGSVFRRKGPDTNVAESLGYHIEEIDTGKDLYMTKREGIQLAYKFGMRNAYIIFRTIPRKDEEGNVIKEDTSMYLQPFPPRKESFTQDDRLVHVFELDENSKIKYPVNLILDTDKCTPDFRVIVEKTYEKRKSSKRKQKKGKRKDIEKRKRRILELEAEISKSIIHNPFED